jgi:hypothetical protein
MAYSPAAHNTATAGRAGFVRLGSGVSGNSDGSIVSNATLLGLTASSVGLGNVTNESKATMFASPVFTGSATGITSAMVGLGNVTNESKVTMFTNPTFTGTASGITYSMIGSAPTFVDWTSWTPTTSGLGTGSIVQSFYSRIGNVVHFYVKLISDANSNGYFTLPFTAVDWHTGTWIYRTTANPYPASHGAWQIPSNNICYFGTLTASIMNAGDIFVFSGTFRV